MSFGDYISSRNLPLIVAAAGILGVTVLGIGSRLVAASKEEEEDDMLQVPSKSILSEQSTRPTSVVLSPSPSPQQSPIMFSSKGGSVPGDSLFFQILESYSGARNSVLSPGLTLSSGASTPSLPGGQGAASSGRRKRRSKNSKKRNTAVTSN